MKQAQDLSCKYSLSLKEAADYFGIGVNRIRELARQHKDANWILMKGTHLNIKREKLNGFLTIPAQFDHIRQRGHARDWQQAHGLASKQPEY